MVWQPGHWALSDDNWVWRPGQYVAPGSRLMALVPLQSVYIAANFKETQLAGLKPGQTVDIAVDSIPGHDFKGTVIAVTHDRWFTRSFDRFVLFGGDGEVTEVHEPVWDG